MGLLDSISSTLTDPGFLGALQAYGNSPGIAPQAASRLPLARPNFANTLGNMAGGYLQGKQTQAQTGLINSEAAGKNIGTLDALNTYNLVAPHLGQPTITMSQLQAGKFDQPTMKTSQQAKSIGLLGDTGASDNAPAPTSGLLSGILPKLFGGGQPAQPQPAAQAQPAPQPSPVQAQSPMPQMAQGAPQAMTSPSAPMMPSAPSAPQGGLLGGGGTQTDDPVAQRILNQRLFGADLTPVQKIIVSQGGNPYDPKYQPLLKDEATKASGVTPIIGGERPGVPIQHYDPASGTYQVQPGAYDILKQGAAATEAGKYPFEIGKIGATGAQERQTKGYEQGLKNQNTLVPMYDPQTQTTKMVTQADALAISQGRQPAVALPNGAGGASAVGLQKDGSYHTANGTVIPAPQSIGPKPTGFQSEASSGQKATQATYEKTIQGWEDSVQPAQQTEQRFQAMAQAFKLLGGPTGAWTEGRAEIGRHLIAAGIPQDVVDRVIKADPAQAQIILKNNFGTSLSTLSAAKLGRITQNEIFALQDNLPNVKLEPAANMAITAQGIGIARQQQALARDWHVAQQLGYPDPYSYEDQWSKANPLQGFVDKATQELAPESALPPGSKAVGTYQGKKVIEMPDGSRHVQR